MGSSSALLRTFASPRLTVVGRGAAGGLGDHLTSDGSTSEYALVVVDNHVRESAAFRALCAGLERAGLQYKIVDEFGPEPDDSEIDRAANAVRGVDYAVVIGVGGGSAMDAAKLLALLVRNGGSAVDWLGPVDPPGGITPLAFMPSTCGTGAEVTRAAMLTVNGMKGISASPQYVGTVVGLDGSLLDALPETVVASSGMDALAHASEALMSTERSPFTVHQSEAAIKGLTSNLESAATGSTGARDNCLYASHMAGLALNAGVQLGHSLAYCIANEVHVPHGVASGLALAYCIAYNAIELEHSGIGRRLASALTQGASDRLVDGAEAVQDLLGRLGMPNALVEIGITREAAARMANMCVREYPRPSNPAPLSVEPLTKLFMAMAGGDLEAAFAARSDGNG